MDSERVYPYCITLVMTMVRIVVSLTVATLRTMAGTMAGTTLRNMSRYKAQGRVFLTLISRFITRVEASHSPVSLLGVPPSLRHRAA